MNETKLHILKKAFVLFLKKNFKEVTMKEIVEITGLSKGAFYYYFESKEQLFHEVINMFYISLQTEVFSSIEYNSLKDFYTNYLKKLTGMLESLSETTKISDNDVNYLGLAFDAIRLVPGYREQIKQSHQAEQTQWENVIKKARENGEIESPMTDEHLARLFIYINDGVGMHLILEGRVGDIIGEIFSLYNDLYQQLLPKK
ncbi:MAG: TetR/AcrR family transcriptional regulator [Cyclobacteriaceae bacterium]